MNFPQFSCPFETPRGICGSGRQSSGKLLMSIAICRGASKHCVLTLNRVLEFLHSKNVCWAHERTSWSLDPKSPLTRHCNMICGLLREKEQIEQRKLWLLFPLESRFTRCSKQACLGVGLRATNLWHVPAIRNATLSEPYSKNASEVGRRRPLPTPLSTAVHSRPLLRTTPPLQEYQHRRDGRVV